MSFDLALLIIAALRVGGTVAGVVLRRRAIAWRIGSGVILIAAIAFALAFCVVTIGDPWQDGGTIAHYHAERVLPQPIAYMFAITAVSLFWIGPPLIGFVIGSAFAFRMEPHGWLRLCVSIAGGLGVFVSSYWLLVVAFM
jgi:hypothetical protein